MDKKIKKLQMCVGILQITFSVFLLAFGLICAPLAFISMSGGGCLREDVFVLVYLMANVIIGGLLMFLGEKMTGAYVVTDKADTKASSNRKWKEILIIVLNTFYIILSAVNLIMIGNLDIISIFFCFLLLIPEMLLVILTFVLLKAMRERQNKKE